MADHRKESFNPPVDTSGSPGPAEAHNGPQGLSLGTTLDTSRTAGMGGRAGTVTPDMDGDTGRAAPAPSGEPEDL
ncbi:hypothetical protein [Deinococcus hopiensis]|uniref:Uncharacterized protein n=1 Tax=Deinococcus hopiensis KR-140 TaxID=695939 RepID=A0A1W1V8T8_9DEIO|nr:hypothetical protein [Deinococcus hopiensis]SMB89673.1 hypothetical protein SAMN00790413_00508 [Deinococcus hopiensis KR-140]